MIWSKKTRLLIDDLETRCRDAKAALAAKQAEAEALHAKVGQLNEQLVDARTEADVLNTRLGELENSVATCESERGRLETEIEELRVALDSRAGEIADLQAEALTRAERVAELDSARSLHQQEAIDRQGQIDREQARIRKLDETIVGLQARITELQNEVQESAKRVSAADAERAMHKQEAVNRQEQIDREQARIRELETKCAEIQDEWKGKFDALEGTYNDLVKRWRATRVRPILITTMPKSGTYYISELLAKGLSIETIIVGNQYFPDDTIRYHQLKEFTNGNYVSQDHFAPSRINLTHIAHYVDRMVCHTRDPRQALLSWVHYIEQFGANAETMIFIYPTLPDGYFQLDLGAKIDWAIDNWLPLLVEWTSGWLDAATTRRDIDIKITRFEDMVTNTEAFVYELLDFFAIPRERLIPPILDRHEAAHFRKGETDEWRAVFTAAQKKRAAAHIPQSLVKRMKWLAVG